MTHKKFETDHYNMDFMGRANMTPPLGKMSEKRPR